MMRSTSGRIAVASLLAVAATACGVLLGGFDGFDTDPGTDDAAVADFELVVPDSLTVEPGTAVALPVSVVRKDGGRQRSIAVRLTSRDDAGLASALATIDPSSLQVALTVTLQADAPLASLAARVVADNGSSTHTRDLTLNVHHPPCAPDQSFGDTNGLVHFASTLGPAIVDGFGLLVDGDRIIVGLGAPIFAVRQLDARGATQWTQTVARSAASLEPAADGAVLVAQSAAVSRLLSDGGVDLTYDAGVAAPFSCDTVFLVRGFPQTAVACGGVPGWTLYRLGAMGENTGSAFIAFATGLIETLSAAEGSDAGAVACGKIVSDMLFGHAAFARWTATGEVDTTFGVSGRLLLDTDTDAVTCIADGARLLALGSIGNQPTLYAVAGSQLDVGFGDGGVVALEGLTGATSANGRLVLDGSSFFTALQTARGVVVSRYARSNGALDPGFASGGSCLLSQLGTRTVTAAVLTPDHKLLVLASGTPDAVLMRIWL